MTQRALLYTILFVFIGAVVWLVVQAIAPDDFESAREADRRAATEQRTVTETTPSRPSAAGSESRRTATGSRDRSAASAGTDDGAGRTAAEAASDETPFAGVRVRVFDPKGAPVSGAPVEIRARHPENPDFWNRLGGPVSTNDNGEAAVRYIDENTALQVMNTSLEGLRVACAIPIPDPPHISLRTPQEPGEYARIELSELAMAWLTPLRVRVEHSDGKPAAGVDVMMRLRRTNQPDKQSECGRARTGVDGIAELSRAEQAKELVASGVVLSSLAFEVSVDTPLLDAPAVPVPGIHAAEDASAMIRLVLPPVGAVVVKVLDAEGGLANDAMVRLDYRSAGDTQPGGDAKRRPWLKDAERVAGNWRLEPVGTGLTLTVRAWYPDGRAPMPSVEIAGPTFDGEDVPVTLRFGGEWPWVVGRVVFPGLDEPQSRIDGKLSTEHAKVSDGRPGTPRLPNSARFNLAIGRDGEFGFRLRGELGEGVRRVLTLSDVFQRREAEVYLPTGAPGSRIDIGTIELRELPLVVAGRTVDEAGKPISGAVVHVSQPVEGSDGRFRNFPVSSNTSNVEGYFDIRSADPPAAIRLTASDRSGRMARMDLRSGLSNVELVLREERERGGVIAGRVLLDEEIALDHLEVTLEMPNGRQSVRGIAEAAGGFEFRGVEPGRVDLSVRTRPAKLPIEQIPNVTVVEGETSTDDRVTWIDLRGRLRYLRLRVVDSDGRPFARQRVVVSPASSMRGGSVKTDEEGRLVALLDSSEDRVRLSSRGIQSVEIDFADDEREVVVERR